MVGVGGVGSGYSDVQIFLGGCLGVSSNCVGCSRVGVSL